MIHPKNLSNVVSKAIKYVRDKLRQFDPQLSILHLGICYNTIVADKTYFIILLSIEKIDADNKLRRNASFLCQLALFNKLPKEWLFEIEGYWEKVLQYMYDINKVKI